MAIAAPAAPIDTIPGVPDPDDIPNGIAPPGAYAPIAVDQHQELLGALRILGRVIDSAWERLPEMLDARTEQLLARLTAPEAQLRPVDAGALEHLCEALEAGVTVLAPYTAMIEARTPGGYTTRLTIQRKDGADFFAALAGMDAWLQANGYSAVTL